MLQAISLWIIRLSMACYAICVLPGLWSRPGAIRVRRRIWIVGAGLCVIHVFLAMAAFHDFSHADSIRHTAEVTFDKVGLNWGGGVYVNYAFTLLWCVDAFFHFRREQYRTPLWLNVFFGFIAFNATVVFGPGWWKYAFGVLVIFAVGLKLHAVNKGSRP